MTIFLYAFLSLIVIGLIVFMYGIKHAEEIDPREPFIYGDYDPKKDLVL